uniref:Deltamethrin resistance protein prag01 domain-containing protein n=1 Tax=Pseudodiaptomus poplesia TaxID=213370 RepID=A0A0U2THQ6_9MAXI|nr:hypothetical protein [Pseudodiaptomus poplesia]
MSRVFKTANLLLRSSQSIRVPVRGKAVQGYARPSIDEIGVPTEPWKRVYDKNQTRFLAQLLGGATSLAVALFVFVTEVNRNPTPAHLLK